MKKNLLFIFVFCIILITGCSEKDVSELNIGQMDPDKIVASFCGVNDYSVVFPDIPSLSENSEVIVYGEVVDMQYLVGENGLCRTNIKVKVLQSLKGNYKTEDTLKVVKDQGIVPVSEYISSFVDKESQEVNRQEFKQYTDKELEQLYVQQIKQDDIMAEVGQKGVYFLKKSAFYDSEETYTRLTGPEGEYIEITSDQFVKTKTLGSEMSEPYILNNDTKNDELDELNILTLDEIISEADLQN